MPILGTVSSGYVEPVYTLAQTFDSSGTYTVPAGVTKITIAGVGGGGKGSSSIGSNTGGSGCGGGGAGASFLVRDITVTSGQTYTVTVGGQAGATSFGSIITANGGANVPNPFTSGWPSGGAGGNNSGPNVGVSDSLINGISGGGGGDT